MFRRAVLALILAALPLAALAATVENLLQVKVPVTDQSAETRTEAFKSGLRDVVARLTGQPGVRDSDVVNSLVDDADRYVQRFQYAAGENGLDLQLSYAGDSLRRALVKAGIPIWEAGRPPVLVWLAAERNGNRVMVGKSQGEPLRQTLDAAAARYGIPLTFPDLSRPAASQVRSSDIWGGFTDPILTASHEYDTPLILLARVEQDGNGWRGRWTLIRDSGRASWSTAGESLQAAFDQASADLASRLVGQYAVLPDMNATQSLRLHVRDVTTAARYAELEKYLSGLSGVVEAQLEAVNGAEASYRLTLDVSADRVLRELQRAHKLIPASSSASVSEESGGRRVLGEGEHLFRLAP